MKRNRTAENLIFRVITGERALLVTLAALIVPQPPRSGLEASRSKPHPEQGGRSSGGLNAGRVDFPTELHHRERLFLSEEPPHRP